MSVGVGSSVASTGYRLLDTFRSLFLGKEYRHRNSVQGDAVALELFEDLFMVARARMIPTSSKFDSRASSAQRVVNPRNLVMGSDGRRGDGTFGDPVPNTVRPAVANYHVRRGGTATCEVGVEVKIISASMNRQVGRVVDDLTSQAAYFKKHSPGKKPLSVAIVAVNHASVYCSYEGKYTCSKCGHVDRVATVTVGSGSKRHPIQEAEATIMKVQNHVATLYDRIMLIRYCATNMAPFDFQWQNEAQLITEYGALLTWLAAEYENRF